MKKRIFKMFAAFVFFAAVAVFMSPVLVSAADGGKKVLVVYYSHSGNTKQIANYIKNASGGDTFEILTVDKYPTQYKALIDQAKEEINRDYKPPIKGKADNIGSYDIIFIGSPSWWATIAPPVATFLSQHDLSGKTIVPFVTHEGTGMGRNARDIARLAPNATILEGKAFRGASVKNAQKEVEEWVGQILK